MKRLLSILTILVGLFGPGNASADDTDVYGVTAVNVQPNVLIIFDNSGSMGTSDVPGEYYDPATTYSGSYTNAAVYQRYKNKGKYYFTKFADDVGLLNCPAPKTALQTVGYVTAAVRSAANNFTCGGTEAALFMGNWLNYDASGAGDMRTRISVAKEVIGNLIDTTTDVRFGLMIFNTDQGGRVIRQIGSSKSDLLTSINALNASTWTPLSETLAEAGLYYAGKNSWFNSGVNYTSPMQYSCQKNYIILMTDGEPTMDNDARVATGAYINGDAIGDYDGDGRDPGTYASYGTDYLDDVAAYLYENDLNASLGVAGESFERQNVITYTIGFRTAQQLLQDTAANGGGKYYTANSISGLSAAFEEILGEIADVNSVFVAPVVPVSRMNRTYAGNNIYIGFFKPRTDGRWFGNIKKYGLGDSGQLLDVDGVEATLPNGEIKDNAQSYWSPEPDGPNVIEGGLGGLLVNQATRNLYTYLGTSTALTDSSNAFAVSNSGLTQSLLDVSTATEREAVINDIHGENRDWIMGDILHSEPAIVHYSDGQSIIFAGSNDGMMHCFRDSDGAELWGFIPPEQLGRLKKLSDADITHDYFTDGSPKVHTLDNGHKILFFGERRGGNIYYALDVTNYTAPVWLYSVNATILGGGVAMLGQSWGNPTTMKIMSGGVEETVVLLPGGYDPNQDLEPPVATDSLGRAAFALKLSNGTVSGFNFNAGTYAAMTHSITDLAGIDSDGDRLVNRVYAPDMKGQIFAFEDDDKDGTWSRRKLFTASATGEHRKIFYSPDVVNYTPTETTLGDIIFFGTGDREDPTDTTVVNRFYAIKNDWQSTTADLFEADLYDATDNLIQMGSETERLAAKNALNHPDTKGWFFELPHPGEKVISAPIVYNGVVYFTTYAPETTVVTVSDPCAVAGGRGTARLYAVDYRTGAAVMDYSDATETDGDGNTIGTTGASKFGIEDRCKTIGTSIPSGAVIAILESGARIYIGVEGGVRDEDVRTKADMHKYYWREVNTN